MRDRSIRKTMFSDRALNNILFHRRQLRVVILTKGKTIRYVTVDKKKQINSKTKHFDGSWFRIAVRVRPKAYKPEFII